MPQSIIMFFSEVSKRYLEPVTTPDAPKKWTFTKFSIVTYLAVTKLFDFV